jgi:hypothetical protein
VKDVHFTDETIGVDLMDDRTITVPLVWYPPLHGYARSAATVAALWDWLWNSLGRN